MQTKESLTKFWKFLKSDSWAALGVTLVIALLVILYIFFPLLQWVTGSALPLVIVESCSMYHSQDGFENIIGKSTYSQNGISLNDTKNWDFRKGLAKGDIIFVVAPKNLKKGDVIIFNGGSTNPIIHRVVDDTEPYQTLGDNNPGQITPGCNGGGCWTTDETKIQEGQILGKAVFKIPYLGWIKLIFFDLKSNSPGACKI